MFKAKATNSSSCWYLLTAIYHCMYGTFLLGRPVYFVIHTYLRTDVRPRISKRDFLSHFGSHDPWWAAFFIASIHPAELKTQIVWQRIERQLSHAGIDDSFSVHSFLPVPTFIRDLFEPAGLVRNPSGRMCFAPILNNNLRHFLTPHCFVVRGQLD